MDATNIDFSTVSDDLGFRYGKADAPVKLYAYLKRRMSFFKGIRTAKYGDYTRIR